MDSHDLMHWHEGQFLQPQHLQAMQRGLFDAIADERRMAWPYAYGVSAMRYSTDALENFLLRFDTLRAVMPSGQVVDVGRNAELPQLNLKQRMEQKRDPVMIYLAVPAWSPSHANVIDAGDPTDRRVKRRFVVSETEALDENIGDNAQPVLVRKVNARLVYEDDDHADLELFPLVRIIPDQIGEALTLAVDEHYVPPCLQVSGSAMLTNLLIDLANQGQAAREELLVHLTQGGYSTETLRGLQLDRVMRLRTINQMLPRMQVAARHAAISPLEMYLLLREMLGQLAALQPDRDLFEVADYQHDDCWPAFLDIAARIRNLVSSAGAGSYLKAPFEKLDETPTLTARLTDEMFIKASEYYLAVASSDDPRQVAKLVEDGDRFKLVSPSLSRSRIRGISLSEERYPPLSLPAEPGTLYFRLNRADSQRVWGRVRDEKQATAVWPESDVRPMKLTLYMTVDDPRAMG